jgi:trans-2,3-dihydro-3-hydroxyanthranilate isomerase
VQRRFVTLDVFTGTRFAGNPLAVVLDAEGLDAGGMQSISREFNLSETVFVFSPENPVHRARLRIFTPTAELPFAGHPTVGTAVLLAGLDGRDARPAFVLKETIGPVQCRVHSAGADVARAEFDVPRLPHKEAWTADGTALAAALGLTSADLERDGWPVERWSAGNPFAFVPVSGLDAMKRCRVDLASFDAVFRGAGHPAAFVFCRETVDPGTDFHARMFAPSMGVAEDPATGSAAAAFAGYLAAHAGYRDGEHRVRIEQGLEMSRPSLIEITMNVRGDQLIGAAIGGKAVVVSQGNLEA